MGVPKLEMYDAFYWYNQDIWSIHSEHCKHFGGQVEVVINYQFGQLIEKIKKLIVINTLDPTWQKTQLWTMTCRPSRWWRRSRSHLGSCWDCRCRRGGCWGWGWRWRGWCRTRRRQRLSGPRWRCAASRTGPTPWDQSWALSFISDCNKMSGSYCCYASSLMP